MRKTLLLAAVAAMALGAGPALAKKQLVIVMKGLDNPFFEAIHQGCEKWNKENASSEYECFYTGPASTSDEAGEAQIVQDMLSKPDTVAMAISPSNAPLIAQTIKSANPSIPIMTVDADLAKGCVFLGEVGVDRHDGDLRVGALQRLRDQLGVGRRNGDRRGVRLAQHILYDLRLAGLVRGRCRAGVEALVLGAGILLVPLLAALVDGLEEGIVQTLDDDDELFLGEGRSGADRERGDRRKQQMFFH